MLFQANTRVWRWGRDMFRGLSDQFFDLRLEFSIFASLLGAVSSVRGIFKEILEKHEKCTSEHHIIQKNENWWLKSKKWSDSPLNMSLPHLQTRGFAWKSICEAYKPKWSRNWYFGAQYTLFWRICLGIVVYDSSAVMKSAKICDFATICIEKLCKIPVSDLGWFKESFESIYKQ